MLEFEGRSLVDAVDVVVLAFDSSFAFRGGAAGFGVVVGENLFQRPAEAAGLDALEPPRDNGRGGMHTWLSLHASTMRRMPPIWNSVAPTNAKTPPSTVSMPGV